MLVAKKPLEFDEITDDMHVWITEKVARDLKIAHTDAGDQDPDIKTGEHTILETADVNTGKPIFADPRTVPVGWVRMQRLDSDDDLIGDEIFIVYNKNAQAIMCGGQVLLSNVLFRVFCHLKELQRINEDRYDCASCGKDLNIITTIIRVCSECEDELSK